MKPSSSTWRLRGSMVLLLLASLALHALFPRSAWAACGPMDIGACTDNAEYSFYYSIASFAWTINRWLLILAYQLDQLRAWMITVAFSGAYQWLTSFVQPVYIPIATAALMLAAILFMLVPLTGQSGFVTIRHVMVWVVMTPVVLVVAGRLVGQAEQVRSDVSAQLFSQMSQAAPGAIFGSPGSDMPAPTPIYPSNPCGTPLVRTTTTGIAMDALAATSMYAGPPDIFCPEIEGPSRDIPDDFYNNPPAYAYDGYVGDLDGSVERRGWVEGMQRGMIRLIQGIIPSFLAVLESLIHLVFSLSMAILWLSLPIGLIFVWFQQTASPVSSVLRRAASVLIVSWMSSLVMGVLSAALLAAAQLGNAGAYTGMAFGGVFLMGYLTILAFMTLWKSIATVEQTALSIAGMSFTQPLQTTAQLATTAVAGAASGVVSGGADYLGMAAIGSAAMAQTKGAPIGERMTYAASAMAGRLPGMGSVGEVAAAMGWLDTDGALYEGIYAGDRSLTRWRSARLELERHGTSVAAGSGGTHPAGPPAGGSPMSGPGGYGGPGGGSAGGNSPAGGSPVPASASGASLAPASWGSAAPAPQAAPAAPAPINAPAPAGPAPAGIGGAGSPPPGGLPVPAANPPVAASPPVPPGVTPAPVASSAAPVPPMPAGPAPNLSPGGTPSATPQAIASPIANAAGGPSASAPSPHVGGVAVTPLPPTNLHAHYAAGQVGSMPNPATGADWQYMGSVQTATGFRHAFQHPAHPLTGKAEIRWIETTSADVAAAHSAQTLHLP